jgi:hypothetical protein
MERLVCIKSNKPMPTKAPGTKAHTKAPPEAQADKPKSVATIQAAKAKKRMGKIELRRFSTVNLSLAKRVCWREKKEPSLIGQIAHCAGIE